MIFPTESPEDEKGKSLKVGACNQKKINVFVMAESQTADCSKNAQKPKLVKYLKICVIEDIKADTLNEKMKENVDSNASIVTDASKSYTYFKSNLKEHKSLIVNLEIYAKCFHVYILPSVMLNLSLLTYIMG